MIEIYDPTTRTSLDLQPSTKTASRTHFPVSDEKPQQVCKDSDFPKIGPKALAQLDIPQLTQKELAYDVVEGMVVRHGRESVKLLVHSSGKNLVSVQLTDYWFSQEFQAFVLVKRTGPGKSQHTIKLSDINRDDPDPSLFAVPSDYHVTEPKPGTGDCSPKFAL